MNSKRDYLRKWRKRLKFTQAELAGVAGCSRVTIILIERLGHYPRPETRHRISNALHVSEAAIWPTLEEVNDNKSNP